MKIYLLSQNDRSGYDTYDSCVVCAESIEDAKSISPSKGNGSWDKEDYEFGTWASNPDKVTATEIGEANADQERGIILSSFNAG